MKILKLKSKCEKIKILTKERIEYFYFAEKEFGGLGDAQEQEFIEDFKIQI